MEKDFEKLGRLIDGAGVPVARWDRQARLIFCNEPFVRCHGAGAALLGRDYGELFGDAAWRQAGAVFAAAFAGRSGAYTRGDPNKRLVEQVLPERGADGSIVAVVTLGADPDAGPAWPDEARIACERLERFAQNIPYPLSYVDRDCVLRFANKAYCAAVGRDASALLGRHIGTARGAGRWAEHRPYFDRALAGEATQYTRLTPLASQGPRWMRTSYVPDLDVGGAVVGLYMVTIDVHEMMLAREQLQRSVERDALTGAYSRRTAMDRLETALLHSREEPFALFFVDLDGFKRVNDALGHREGDSLLAGVVTALQAAVRAEDSVGRFGGDEFVVLARVRDEAGAHALAEHLLDAVRHGGAALPRACEISASIGYALAPRDGDTASALLQLADSAMYGAKRLGKNRALHCATLAAAPR